MAGNSRNFEPLLKPTCTPMVVMAAMDWARFRASPCHGRSRQLRRRRSSGSRRSRRSRRSRCTAWQGGGDVHVQEITSLQEPWNDHVLFVFNGAWCNIVYGIIERPFMLISISRWFHLKKHVPSASQPAFTAKKWPRCSADGASRLLMAQRSRFWARFNSRVSFKKSQHHHHPGCLCSNFTSQMCLLCLKLS